MDRLSVTMSPFDGGIGITISKKEDGKWKKLKYIKCWNNGEVKVFKAEIEENLIEE